MLESMATGVATNPLREGLPDDRGIEPCALVIFGASGDLTRRKLIPAVYNLMLSRLLPPGFAVIGVARREKSNASFAGEMRDAVGQFSRRKPIDDAAWNDLSRRISYVRGTFEAPATYQSLRQELERVDRELGTRQGRVFYLAVAPHEVLTIISQLREAGLVKSDDPSAPYARFVIEKPFGTDLPSAQQLNQDLSRSLEERQIFRIDHYLGKETVQNLLVLRFANTIFEAIWNRKHVHHVEITVAEEIGVEGRGKFYEQTGVIRDVVQNHALQLLCLVAMEPPVTWRADAVRDEKVKVLESLAPVDEASVKDYMVRGQYTRGTVRGDEVPGYREEPDVAKDSQVETYAAMRIQVDNWRWAGVPFFLRAGKRLPKRVTEIAVHFQPLPHPLFRQAPGSNQLPNVLTLRIQPDEGIALRFVTKVPGSAVALRDVAMDFRYGTAFGSNTPEAYERLLLDVMRGDPTLFTRHDEVEAQWRYIDPILAACRTAQCPLGFYPAGTWGPPAADELVARAGVQWRKP